VDVLFYSDKTYIHSVKNIDPKTNFFIHFCIPYVVYGMQK